MEKVRGRHLTRRRLRTLAPDHPNYHPRYRGDLCSRDTTYYQGTVWLWLLGPFIDVRLKVNHRDRLFGRGLRAELLGKDLREAGVDSISEVVDS
jgi:glycogen debranching enzyme